MFKDEFEIAQIRVGKTPPAEVNSLIQVQNRKGPPGYQVDGADGMTLHYYTNETRTAVLCAGARDGKVLEVRLGLGLWGPLAEVQDIPPHAVSTCSLEVMGTASMACLGAPEDEEDIFAGTRRVREVYGPPTREQDGKLEYDWPYEPTPRRMWFRVEGEKVLEMCLWLDNGGATQLMRPLGPPQDYERVPNLPARLKEKFQQGQYVEVLAELNEADVDPNDLKVEVATRIASQKADVERIQGLLEHLETYASYNPPEVLRTRLALAQAKRASGNVGGARHELNKLWELLQASRYYQEPEVQSLVRRTALELELVGEGRYAEAIRQADGTA